MSDNKQQNGGGSGGTAAAPARDTRDPRAVAAEVDRVRVEQFNDAQKRALRSRAGGMLPEDYPERDKFGNLTREGMLAALRGGGSVLFKGRSIVNEADIPTEAELAGDDPEQQEAALAGIRRTREDLDRQERLLMERRGQGPAKDSGNALGKATGDNPGAWGADAAHGSEAAARAQGAPNAPQGATGKTAGQDRREEQEQQRREQQQRDAADNKGGGNKGGGNK